MWRFEIVRNWSAAVDTILKQLDRNDEGIRYISNKMIDAEILLQTNIACIELHSEVLKR